MKKNLTFPSTIICLSHLRWDFVYQRPQHLLSRFAKGSVVYFFEEPVFDAEDNNFISISERGKNIHVVVPHLKQGLTAEQADRILSASFDHFVSSIKLEDCLFWYYTPLALKFTDKHKPKAIVYDCMDELSAFKFAHSETAELEKKLMAKSDVVFTGGQSLYEAKKKYHSNIFPFPSSIERSHFQQALSIPEAADQADITGPRIGFFGVIDERFDMELIREIADQRPDWQIVLIGPVVKIDPATLPKNQNIHYLGQRSYQQLPAYLAGWDIALIPFLLNESTRFISPTKTPEYLAANIPVVSTPIRDVINPYGMQQLVQICSNSDEFILAIEKELAVTCREEWFAKVNHFLKHLSWDKTYSDMSGQIRNTINNLNRISIAS